MSTTKTQRIVSLALAIMFALSTIGLVAYYVLANKQDQQQLEQQQAIQDQLNTQVQQQQLQQQKAQEGKLLQNTALQNFQPVASIPSLQKIDTIVGTGAEAKSSDTVTVHYTGAVAATGTIFQSSLDTGNTATFGLNQVIAGWTQGIPGMKVGGTRRLLIPASLAYGATAPSGSGIPANADLVFDVQLVKIGQ